MILFKTEKQIIKEEFLHFKDEKTKVQNCHSEAQRLSKVTPIRRDLSQDLTNNKVYPLNNHAIQCPKSKFFLKE